MNNPAKRLLLLLKAGKSSKINVQADCLQVWKKLLNVTGNNDAQTLTRLGKTIALVGEIEDELKQIEDIESESLLAWVPLLKNAFASQNLAGPWSGFISKIDSHTMNYLSNCSALLDANFKDKYKPIESTDALADEIGNLLKEVLESDLPDVVKSFMSMKLREIQRALDEYHITGNGPIVKAVESYVGYVVINNKIMSPVAENTTVQKFGQFMNRLAIVTTLTMATLQLPDEVKGYFPGETIIEIPADIDENVDQEKEIEQTIIT